MIVTGSTGWLRKRRLSSFNALPVFRRRWSGPTALQPPRDQGAKLDSPVPDRLVADLVTALRQELLDVTKTEAETEVEPDGMVDDVHRESVVLELNRHREICYPSVAFATNTGDLFSFA